MNAFVRTCLLVAACCAAAPCRAQLQPPAVSAAASATTPSYALAGDAPSAPAIPLRSGQPEPLPAALRPSSPAAAAPENAALLPLGRYTLGGMIAGAAVGLAYGLAQGDDALGLSPVLETAIGAGIGFYIGAAIDVIRSRR